MPLLAPCGRPAFTFSLFFFLVYVQVPPITYVASLAANTSQVGLPAVNSSTATVPSLSFKLGFSALSISAFSSSTYQAAFTSNLTQARGLRIQGSGLRVSRPPKFYKLVI